MKSTSFFGLGACILAAAAVPVPAWADIVVGDPSGRSHQILDVQIGQPDGLSFSIGADRRFLTKDTRGFASVTAALEPLFVDSHGVVARSQILMQVFARSGEEIGDAFLAIDEEIRFSITNVSSSNRSTLLEAEAGFDSLPVHVDAPGRESVDIRWFERVSILDPEGDRIQSTLAAWGGSFACPPVPPGSAKCDSSIGGHDISGLFLTIKPGETVRFLMESSFRAHAVSVPEPASMAIFAIGSMFVLVRSRNTRSPERTGLKAG